MTIHILKYTLKKVPHNLITLKVLSNCIYVCLAKQNIDTERIYYCCVFTVIFHIAAAIWRDTIMSNTPDRLGT